MSRPYFCGILEAVDFSRSAALQSESGQVGQAFPLPRLCRADSSLYFFLIETENNFNPNCTKSYIVCSSVARRPIAESHCCNGSAFQRKMVIKEKKKSSSSFKPVFKGK